MTTTCTKERKKDHAVPYSSPIPDIAALGTKGWRGEQDSTSIARNVSTGPELNPPLISRTGLTGGTSVWWRLGPWLADRGFHVTAIDFRGHMRSPRTDSYRLFEQAEDLPAGPFDLVVGHSSGASVAVIATAQHGEAFAKRLVLIDPPLHLSPSDHAAAAKMCLDELEDTDDTLRRGQPRWSKEDRAAKLECAHQADRNMVEKTFLDNNPWNQMKEARSIGVTTLAIAGDLEAGSMWSQADEREAAKTGHFRTIRVAKAGHSVHRDDWRAFIQVLGAFLG